MANFHDLLGILRNPGDDGVPDTIYDDLVQDYDTVFQGYTANTEQQRARIAELEAETSRLKSANYDLLMSVGTGDDLENQQDNEQDKEISFDDLFLPKGS